MDEKDSRRLVYLLVALFVGINIYLLWFPDIIQDISEGFSSCERPVRIMFGNRNASQLPLIADEAARKWKSFSKTERIMIGNQRQQTGFVTILIPVLDLEDKNVLDGVNVTLSSLIRHSWNRDLLEMSVIIVIHTSDSDEPALALIKDYIYYINIGFLTVIRLPLVSHGEKLTISTNVFYDDRKVFQQHFPKLFPYLERWNSHVMYLCPGYLASERVLSSMRHYIQDVGTSVKGPYDGESWVVLDFCREDPSCPLAGRLLRLANYRGLYDFMTIFDNLQSVSHSLEGYAHIRTQYTLYVMKPELFSNPLNKLVNKTDPL